MKLSETEKAQNFILNLNYDKKYYIESFNKCKELRFNLAPTLDEYFLEEETHLDAMEIIRLISNDCDFINYNYHFKDARTPYTSNKGNFLAELVDIEILYSNINMKHLTAIKKNSFKKSLENPETELRFCLRSVPINVVYNESEIDEDKENCIKVQDKYEAICLINKFLDKLDITSNNRHHIKDERLSTGKEGYLFTQIVKVKKPL